MLVMPAEGSKNSRRNNHVHDILDGHSVDDMQSQIVGDILTTLYAVRRLVFKHAPTHVLRTAIVGKCQRKTTHNL